MSTPGNRDNDGSNNEPELNINMEEGFIPEDEAEGLKRLFAEATASGGQAFIHIPAGDIEKVFMNGFMSDPNIIPIDENARNMRRHAQQARNTTKNGALIDLKMLKFIDHKKLKPTELFYNEDTQKDIARIERALSLDRFTEIQKRMSERNSSRGICINFYGKSGTGKTESVYQLASRIGRDILKYNIADSESEYVGKQNRIINMLFKEYKAYCEASQAANKPLPILLLNEADSLFSKRNDLGDDMGNVNAMRTNNSLQAELLEALEELDGIMICTTNRFDNFDEAFYRRFLFKTEFGIPDRETQKKIWASKFSRFSEDDIERLTDEFDFTGGQIENVRKLDDIEYILEGEEASIDTLIEICDNEIIGKDGDAEERHIGFC